MKSRGFSDGEKLGGYWGKCGKREFVIIKNCGCCAWQYLNKVNRNLYQLRIQN